jgi:magnesium-transporting ATPase (P-type)
MSKNDQDVKEDKELTREELVQQLENEKVQLEKKLRSSRKKYDVKGIEFSWLFQSQPRVNFLRALFSDKADIEIFSNDIIKYCLLFLWSYYRWVIIAFIYIPFLSYFTTFILYATWIHNEKEKEDDKNGPYYRANISMINIILAAIVMNSVLEFNKLFYETWRYFISFWNFISFASLVLNTFLVIGDLSGLKETHFLPISACAVLLMWVKLFYF